MRFVFSLLAAVLLATPAPALAYGGAGSMAPIDITPKGTMQATPYYGSGSLGAISTVPLAGDPYQNSDDLYSRNGSGEGMHDGGNLYGLGFDSAAPVGTMTNTASIVDQNFTFIPAYGSSGAQATAPVYAPPPPLGNVQGFDNKPTGSFYDGAARPEWNNERTMTEWRDQTRASAMPAVKDGAYFSGLNATPQQHEPYHVVVANNADWTLMWQQHIGRDPPGRLMPGQVAVASLLGPRNYTGYEARVKIIGERADMIQVAATQATPAPQIAQMQRENSPYAVLVIQAGSKGVEVVQNRALNTGNYNYADDPKVKAINWDPAQFYASPYHEKRVIVEATGGTYDGPSSYSTGTSRTAPSDPRAVQ